MDRQPTREQVRNAFRMYASSRKITSYDSLTLQERTSEEEIPEFYEWLTTADEAEESIRQMSLMLLCFEYLAKKMPERPGEAYLDDFLPDEVVYSLTDSQRMDLVETYHLRLKTYGSACAQWNGRMVAVEDSAVRERIRKYRHTDQAVPSTKEIEELMGVSL